MEAQYLIESDKENTNINKINKTTSNKKYSQGENESKKAQIIKVI